MSSTGSFGSQAIAPSRPRLKAFVTLYALTVIAALIVLILLLWQFSSSHLAKAYKMPPDWEQRQPMSRSVAFERTVFSIVIPTDLIHTLLCLDWYYGRRNVAMRERQIRGAELDTTRQTPFPPQHPPHALVLALAPRKDNSYIHSLTKPLHFALLTLYDVVLLTFLSHHTFLYVASIAHSTDCSSETFALAPPLLSNAEKCDRIKWATHSAGGAAAVGAGMLGMLHLGIIGFRGSEAAVRCRKVSKSAKTQGNWACAPRDIDVNPRRMEKQERRTAAVGEEESSVGMKVRCGRRDMRMRETEEKERESEQSGWCEALLECLMP